MSANFQETLLREVVVFVSPILALEDEKRRTQLLAAIGWDLSAVTGLPIEKLNDAL